MWTMKMKCPLNAANWGGKEPQFHPSKNGSTQRCFDIYLHITSNCEATDVTTLSQTTQGSSAIFLFLILVTQISLTVCIVVSYRKSNWWTHGRESVWLSLWTKWLWPPANQPLCTKSGFLTDFSLVFYTWTCELWFSLWLGFSLCSSESIIFPLCTFRKLKVNVIDPLE